MGRRAYPEARQILITADGGGANGSRVRLWKLQLQRLADELGMVLHVRHFPPGTSKWSTIEHRMFWHLTENWPAQPLTIVYADRQYANQHLPVRAVRTARHLLRNPRESG
ncbi:MAG: hypothetical protein HYV63_09805 [Candidatus Schekmanbacteria bacterium]|nr:hypothetical protein [Candidatus Schekmanbacteria bacterium]